MKKKDNENIFEFYIFIYRINIQINKLTVTDVLRDSSMIRRKIANEMARFFDVINDLSEEKRRVCTLYHKIFIE